MRKSIKSAGLFAALLVYPVIGCTDLTEVPTSAITPDNFYKNESEIIGGLASVYNTMQQVIQNPYHLSEVSTDEIIVPTRGVNWADGGKWLDLHHHTFTANSPGMLDNGNGAYEQLFMGVARANTVLAATKDINYASKTVVTAELRALRAYYYFLIQDLFGGVPIVEDIAVMPRARNTRAEVFKFIETELLAARPGLPSKPWPAEMNGRLTQGAVDAILASLYLNAEVFSGTVTATGLTKGPARWADAIARCDMILGSGNYTLSANWKDNFVWDNYKSTEIIMAAKMTEATGLGLDFLNRTLHYNQYTPGGWNGFSALTETYNAFSTNDIRRQIFLAGPQYNVETGARITQTDGSTPLDFDPNIVDDKAAPENAGARIYKWPNDPAHVERYNGNDYATFRLGEIYLIKAEAMNELGQTANAIALVNSTTRARAFPTVPNPISPTLSQSAFRDALLQERLFELMAEGKRRQDRIRMGRYNEAWGKFKPVSPAYKILFPIPQPQMDNNPLLVQNAGY
ncbi:MAG: RagB/SusD family nutrient uptake outer membrane protein [Gemmatimonadota bacterium]|nr:RagB/SusD family nutrient uptake outer membrane protein [Gemmatimonadota bacterium]